MAPFRLDPEVYGEFRAKIQFTTSAEMPAMIYKACLATGTGSNTVYIQHAVCEALARDLDIPLQRLLDALPSPRSRSNNLFDVNRKVIGPASLHEDVKPRQK